jgi:hypothetical protein
MIHDTHYPEQDCSMLLNGWKTLSTPKILLRTLIFFNKFEVIIIYTKNFAPHI